MMTFKLFKDTTILIFSMKNTNEIWKTVKGFSNYRISNLGNVFNKVSNRLLTLIKRENNHYVVTLCQNGKCKQFQLHFLIADNFIDNPNNYTYVFHINGNKDNNSIDNLKWATPSDIKKHVMKLKIAKFDIKNHESQPDEKWMDIKGYENYVISNMSRIINKETNRFLKPTLSAGYYSVNLCNLLEDKPAKLFRVHRLVAMTFVSNPDPDNKTYVDHINNKKLDNRASNLRWVTPKENTNYYFENHRKPCGRAIFQYNFNGKLIKKWDNMSEIIKSNPNFTSHNIYNNLRGKYNSSYGYIWKYEEEAKIVFEKDEIFKNVGIINGKDFSNYMISNYGKVRSLYRDQINKSTLDLGGYYFIRLCGKNNSKSTRFLIHTLVALTFIKGRTEQRCYVNHIDENKQNNYYKNLEWVTNKENITHSKGKKVKQIDIETGKTIRTFSSIRDAARSNSTPERKLNFNGISNCCNNKQESYAGFKWQFA